jgi:penicillin G amidase
MIPLLGGRYRFGERAWPGSTDTLWRANHDLSADQVTTGFGAQARHVADMADPDSNWFALLGGNDGWFESENFLDQIDMFASGAMVRIPLRMETVRAEFPHRTMLTP